MVVGADEEGLIKSASIVGMRKRKRSTERSKKMSLRGTMVDISLQREAGAFATSFERHCMMATMIPTMSSQCGSRQCIRVIDER
jgi:hypothetical protein